MLLVLAADMLFSCGDWGPRKKNCEPGEGFAKICRAKKRVGDGGQLERAG